MRKFTLFTVCLFLAFQQFGLAQAPDLTRLLQVNTYGLQTVDAVSSDANYVYMTAGISGSLTYDGATYTAVGLKDVLMQKISNDGTVVWTKQINAQVNGSISVNAIKVDGSGNIYVVGFFSGTTTIGTSTITSDESNNAYVAKFDADGNGVWATTFLSFYMMRCKFAFDNSSNIYLICGSAKLLKINSSGVKQWEQSYPFETLNAIAVIGSNLYIGGVSTSDFVSFGSLTIYNQNGYYTGFLVKGDLDGNFTSSVIADGTSGAYGTSITDIALDSNDSLVISGAFTQNLTLGSVSVTNTNSQFYTYIAKCGNDLNFKWIKPSTQIGNTNHDMLNYWISIDGSGNIYEYNLNSAANFSFGSIASVNTLQQQFLFKFDSKGNALASYAISNSSINRTIVTSTGKIITGCYNNSSSTTYGNFTLTQYSNSLVQEWSKNTTFSKSGNASIEFVKHDSMGNTYLKTKVLKYCDYFGTEVNPSTYSCYLSKQNVNGNLVWLKEIPNMSTSTGSGSQIEIDKDNNIVTIGKFGTSTTIGTTTLTSSPKSSDVYVAKYTPEGEVVWAVKVGASFSYGNEFAMATDKSGNIIISGTTTTRSNFLVKFDSSGNKLWEKEYPMESPYLSCVSVDDNNNIYQASEVHLSDITSPNSVTIGSVTITQTTEDGAIVLMKLDPDGNPIWAKSYGKVSGANYSDGWPSNIKNDASGNTYLFGYFKDNALFGTTTLTNPFEFHIGYSYYVAKVNSTGDVVWVKPIYSSSGTYVYGDFLKLDEKGNVYITDNYKDKINVEGTEYTCNSVPNYDLFVSKYSNDGELQWIKTIPGVSGSALSVVKEDVLSISGNILGITPEISGITINMQGGSNSIVATLGSLYNLSVSTNSLSVGYAANSSNDFDITSNTSWTVESDQTWLQANHTTGTDNGTITLTASENPSNSARTANVTVSGTGVASQTIVVTQNANTTGVKDVDLKNCFTVYPNPSNGMFYVDFSNMNSEDVTITITNSLGTTVKEIKLNRINGSYKQDVDLTSMSKGVYFVTVQTNKSKSVKSVVLAN